MAIFYSHPTLASVMGVLTVPAIYWYPCPRTALLWCSSAAHTFVFRSSCTSLGILCQLRSAPDWLLALKYALNQIALLYFGSLSDALLRVVTDLVHCIQ